MKPLILNPGRAIRQGLWLSAAAVLAGWAAVASAGNLGQHPLLLPSAKELVRVLLLQDYNTRVVITGATLLGLAAGLSGTFLILRKRALLSDTLSHATLPGIALAFIVMTLTLGSGKHLIGLIIGAALFAVLGTGSVLVIQRYSRLKDDAALGIVLSVYFGLGIAILGIATRMASGNAAGLTSFIYGKTASMLYGDALLIAVTALVAALLCLLFFKEFALICFDADFAAAQGWPVARLDFFMMSLVVLVTVVGLQAVGLILVVALLIIPPSAARFWSHRLSIMLLLSAVFGAVSGLFGAGLSALMANLPAGAVIVLTAASVFFFSLIFGTTGGLLKMVWERIRLTRKVTAENLLRELYEWQERARIQAADRDPTAPAGPRFEELMKRRSWSVRLLKRELGRLARGGWIRAGQEGRYGLTAEGRQKARDVVRRHRLWEAYLISHADTAAGAVDWGADAIEHVIDERIVAELEASLPEMGAQPLPESPHRLDPPAVSS
jgi:manganese/zinc/iron transport system permease protein